MAVDEGRWLDSEASASVRPRMLGVADAGAKMFWGRDIMMKYTRAGVHLPALAGLSLWTLIVRRLGSNIRILVFARLLLSNRESGFGFSGSRDLVLLDREALPRASICLAPTGTIRARPELPVRIRIIQDDRIDIARRSSNVHRLSSIGLLGSRQTMQTVKRALAENFSGPAHKLASGDEAFSLDEVPDLSGKTAVLTGGSEGIGFGCGHTLLKHGISKLFILSRTPEKFGEAAKAIDEDLGAGTSDRIAWKQCDLSDWEQTAEIANAIRKETNEIHIVINNAARGIMTQQFAPSNGIDLHMAGNHIGHVVLTSHLLPVLKATTDAGHTVRIVNLASSLHEAVPTNTAFASVDELQKDLGPNAQYGRSKLATLLYAKYLARHLTIAHPNILANATHPGIVDTAQTNVHIHEPYPLLGYGMSVGLKPFRKSQFEGCVSTMYAATVCEDSGLYITPPKIVEEGSTLANDTELAERLMKLTRQVVDEKTNASERGCPLKDY